MKANMCYGDSLTWGYNPRDGTRYAFDQRWPGVLQSELGSGFRVIEEALNGRTTVTKSWLLPLMSDPLTTSSKYVRTKQH
jgi:lysophospholipase L1-like esterase